ncbi:MAG: glycoside hydrolase family 2 protein [Bacteroidales bacterium]|nr:glycoside hydrolase family 2 protein [Bacteroidales bacterium]
MKTSILRHICLLISLVSIASSCKNAVPVKSEPEDLSEVISLNQGWNFRMEGAQEWMPATVPGCVHTDLIDNEKIEDPFFRNNEKDLQWIDKENWVYQCEFEVSEAQVRHMNSYLKFRGLDTYAKVQLNGIDILEADNMFRCWTVDTKPYLTPGKNTLTITFLSPVTIGLGKLDELGYGLPASNDQSQAGGLDEKKVSVFTRKAPYHYGWDWGPRFVTSGIWRPVELIFTDRAKIEQSFFQVSNLNDIEANIDAIFTIQAALHGEYQLSIRKKGDKQPFATSTLFLETGDNSVTVPFTVQGPRLWWPNGMGEQHLYELEVELRYKDTLVDRLSSKMGIRSIELVREPDSSGTSFYFSVNGQPVFAKGANYIPNDNFLNRVTDEKYEEIVRSAAESNMNMLRVWGGGIYENDIFYELCDKYGIMVWQDFMFACSMYPGDDDFLENVRQEAIQNVMRLQNHPSLAIWVGNNEIDGAWCEGDMNCGWGWKQRYTNKQRKEIWHSYDTLFHHILPDVISLYDPTRDYWPSSPQADWGKHAGYNTLGEGDIHYWGVWHGNAPFSSYFEIVGRFMSEYGFQSLPDKQSIEKFTLPEDWDFESEVLLSHQRSGYGNSRIIDYMKKLYPVPEDFDQLLYIGQVMQAEAIKSAILAHRAAKPHCMGSLYWQLNDCWPSASWSSIDYYTSWKALQYFAKKAYAPVAISFVPGDGTTEVFINSDLWKASDVTVNYSLRDFRGDTLLHESLQAILDPAKGTGVIRLDEKELAGAYELNNLFLDVEIVEGGSLLAKDHYFFVPAKDLALPEALVDFSTKAVNGKLLIELKSDVLVKNLYLWTKDSGSRFSDNYFDLLPGEPVSIELLGGTKGMEIHTMNLNSIILASEN